MPSLDSKDLHSCNVVRSIPEQLNCTQSGFEHDSPIPREHPELQLQIRVEIQNFIRAEMAEMRADMRDEIRKYVEKVLKPIPRSNFVTPKRHVPCEEKAMEQNTSIPYERDVVEREAANPDVLASAEAADENASVQLIGRQGCYESDDSDTYRDLLSRLERLEQSLRELPGHVRESSDSSLRVERASVCPSRVSRISNQSSQMMQSTYAITVSFDAVALSEGGFPKLDVIVDDLVAQDLTYNLSETMWEVMPFFGLGILTLNDQCCVILVALANVAVQGLFIGLVATSLLDNDFTDASIVATLEKWRILYAHNPDYADEFTDEPLALSLCARSFFMMQGAAQASLYNDIDDYTELFLGSPVGIMMCLLSIFLWILTCAEESKRILLYFIGIWTPNVDSSKNLWQVPYSCSFVQILDHPVLWLYGEERQKNYQIFITPLRALSLTVLVLIPRAIILISIALIGTLFLVQTLQLTDLILNAVALNVVLDVDELLFNIFCPPAARRLLYKSLPLRIPRIKGTCKSIGTWLKLAFVLTCLTAVVVLFLGPQTKTISDVRSVMCDGEQDFLAVQLPFGPVAAARTSKSIIDRGSYKYRATFQKTKLAGGPNENSLLYLENGAYALTSQFQVRQLKTWRDRSIKEIAELPRSDEHHVTCANLDLKSNLSNFAMIAGIGSIIGNEDMKSCDDVAHLCFNETSLAGKVARLICAETCGMMPTRSGALSGLFLDSQEDGVPALCRYSFASSLFQAPCKDGVATQMEWQRYADGVAAYFNPVFTEISTSEGVLNTSHFDYIHRYLRKGMVTNGCSFFGHSLLTGQVKFPKLSKGFLNINFCDPQAILLQGRRSIRPMCPEICKCNSVVRDHFKNISSLERSVVDATQCPFRCFQ